MKRLLARKIEAASAAVFLEGDLASLPKFFAPDYVIRLGDAEAATGHQIIRRSLALLRRAFPELHVDVEVLVEAKDRIAWQRTFRGIQRGPFHGFPSSDREVVWREMVTSRFQDGLIVEEWLVSNLAESLLNSRKQAAAGARASPARRPKAKS